MRHCSQKPPVPLWRGSFPCPKLLLTALLNQESSWPGRTQLGGALQSWGDLGLNLAAQKGSPSTTALGGRQPSTASSSLTTCFASIILTQVFVCQILLTYSLDCGSADGNLGGCGSLQTYGVFLRKVPWCPLGVQNVQLPLSPCL